MQNILGSSRGHWAPIIGSIIYSLNEIDYLLTFAYGITTKQDFPIKMPANWEKLTSAARLKVVEDALIKEPESPATLRLKRIFIRTKDLMEKRNHIAHGVLGIASGSQLEMYRYQKSSNRIISMNFSEILIIEETARKLSDDFSFLISLCKLHKDILIPYKPGEAQGMEVIKPHDPAPALN